MPKRKTVKAYAKRFKQTASGKIRKVKAGQNHFNANETGKTKRNKRQAHAIVNKKNVKEIKRLSN